MRSWRFWLLVERERGTETQDDGRNRDRDWVRGREGERERRWNGRHERSSRLRMNVANLGGGKRTYPSLSLSLVAAAMVGNDDARHQPLLCQRTYSFLPAYLYIMRTHDAKTTMTRKLRIFLFYYYELANLWRPNLPRQIENKIKIFLTMRST